jgi:hypothetical protein
LKAIRSGSGILIGSSLVGIITVVALGGWHLRNRRHPNWSVCPDGRFYITIGYPAVVIALYWLVNSSTTAGLEWALGNLWAIGAMTAFVYGFNALNAVSERQNLIGRAVKSFPDPAQCAGRSSGHGDSSTTVSEAAPAT